MTIQRVDTARQHPTDPAINGASHADELADLRDFFENAAISLHWVDGKGIIVRANRAELEFLGYDEAEYVGHHIAEFHADQDVIEDLLGRLLRNEIVHDYEARLRCKDGTIKHVRIDSSVLWREGEFVHTRCFTRDNTRRKLLEDDLRMSEERYRTLAGAIPAMVTLTTSEGRVEFVNQSLLDYTGLSEIDAHEGDWTRILHPDDMAANAAEWGDKLTRGEVLTGEVRVRRHDGTYRWHFGRIAPVRDAAGNVRLFVGAHIDIDDRKQAEERYRSLVEAMPAMVSTTTPHGVVTYHNTQWLDYTGRTREKMLGGNWAEIVHPDDMAALVAGWTNALAQGVAVEAEYRARRHDGAYRWVRSFTVPVRDVTGALTMWIDAALDIHDRKESEQRLAETARELEKANAAKDEFLGLVSHELKTPITTIFGNAQVLRTRGDQLDEESRLAALDDVVHESERLHRIIDNLLVLARLEQGQEIEAEPLLVGRIASRLVEEHRQRFPRRDVRVTITDDPLPVEGQPVYIEQVIRNLLSNAEKYSPSDTPIEVDISRDGEMICVSVLDRGSGVSVEEADLLFTPFYRVAATASKASGVGIGLAVCKRLIEAQGGAMWARPRDGGGADFGFSLPRVEAAADE